MEVLAKVKISNVQDWSTNWENESEKEKELKALVWDMKVAIRDRCGIDFDNISIEAELANN